MRARPYGCSRISFAHLRDSRESQPYNHFERFPRISVTPTTVPIWACSQVQRHDHTRKEKRVKVKADMWGDLSAENRRLYEILLLKQCQKNAEAGKPAKAFVEDFACPDDAGTQQPKGGVPNGILAEVGIRDDYEKYRQCRKCGKLSYHTIDTQRTCDCCSGSERFKEAVELSDRLKALGLQHEQVLQPDSEAMQQQLRTLEETVTEKLKALGTLEEGEKKVVYIGNTVQADWTNEAGRSFTDKPTKYATGTRQGKPSGLVLARAGANEDDLVFVDGVGWTLRPGVPAWNLISSPTTVPDGFERVLLDTCFSHFNCNVKEQLMQNWAESQPDLQVLHRVAGVGGVVPPYHGRGRHRKLTLKEAPDDELAGVYKLFAVVGVYDPTLHTLRFA